MIKEYVDYGAAVSWIAFGDFNALKNNTDIYQPHRTKPALIAGIKIIVENTDVSEDEWSDIGTVSKYDLKKFIIDSGKTHTQLIADLEAEIEADKTQYLKYQAAEKSLWNKLHSGEIEIFGRREKCEVIEKISLDKYRLEDVTFDPFVEWLTIHLGKWEFTGEVWKEPQIKLLDILQVWTRDEENRSLDWIGVDAAVSHIKCLEYSEDEACRELVRRIYQKDLPARATNDTGEITQLDSNCFRNIDEIAENLLKKPWPLMGERYLTGDMWLTDLQVEKAAFKRVLGDLMTRPVPAELLLEEDTKKNLNIVKTTSAPPPITPVRGRTKILPDHYQKEVTEADYIRCITDGDIKVHHLAALACEMSPPVSTANNDHDTKLYMADLSNATTPLGLICSKLVHAIQTDKLSIISVGYGAGVQWNLISLSKGIEWLEKQPSITISDGLKLYNAENFQNVTHVKQENNYIIKTQSTLPKKYKVTKNALEDFLKIEKDKSNGSPPARDEHWKATKIAFPDNRVPREMFTKLRKKVWGTLSPGPRKEADA